MSAAAKTWADYLWPEWVPTEVRKQIEDFWSASAGRDPEEWTRDAAGPYNQAPVFGARVTLGTIGGKRKVTGRYVHAWNNIGRIVLDDGSFEYVSTCGYKGPTAPPVAWRTQRDI